MVFVNSMSDLFHKKVPDAFIDQVFATMEEADWHVFQVLKQAQLADARLFAAAAIRAPEPPAHIWLRRLRRGWPRPRCRIEHLRAAPAGTTLPLESSH